MAEGKEDVKLLGVWASPFVLRTVFALNLKKVTYELVPADPIKKSDLLLTLNPIYKKIPVLLHGDRTICESMIIVEYVDTIWKNEGPPILPSDPYEKAMSRFWVTYIDDKLFPSMVGMIDAETTEEAAKAAEQIFSSLQQLERAFEKCSKGKTFFGGDTIGFLDIALGGFIVYIRVLSNMNGIEFLDKEKTPLLAEWAAQFSANEAIRDVIPDHGVIIEFIERLMAMKEDERNLARKDSIQGTE